MRLSVLGIAAFGAAAGLALGAGDAVAAAQPSRVAVHAAVTPIRVVAVEFRFRLSKASTHRGTVVFRVVNRGKVAHDFRIAGKKTPVIKPGKSALLRVVFRKAGRYPYLCTVPGHAAAGMKGVLRVA